MKKISAILFGIRFRSSLLFHYLLKAEIRKRTPFKEAMFHLFSPTMNAVANKNAQLVKEDENYKYYKIKGYNDLFIYPSAAPFYSFAMVMAESVPRHWHYYEIPQTPVTANDVIADCGSAEGFFAFRHQHTAGHIYVIEPMPLFISSLNFGTSSDSVLHFRMAPALPLPPTES